MEKEGHISHHPLFGGHFNDIRDIGVQGHVNIMLITIVNKLCPVPLGYIVKEHHSGIPYLLLYMFIIVFQGFRRGKAVPEALHHTLYPLSVLRGACDDQGLYRRLHPVMEMGGRHSHKPHKQGI